MTAMAALTQAQKRAAKKDEKSWLAAHRYLLLRRLSQLLVLGIFLIGPWFGLWLVEGNLNSSLTLGILPLTDPYVFLQSLLAGQWPTWTAAIGTAIVALFYALVGGRLYCSWVCPINPVSDAAAWLHRKLGLAKGWQPKRQTRLWVLATTLVVSAASGTIAWELVNPISMLHRGLIFGIGFAWAFVLAVFLFDLLVARHGWCGHLCPVGGFYGLLNTGSLLRVAAPRRAACDDCMDCFEVGPEPHVITPALRGKGEETPIIVSHDCTDCGRCIDVCTKDVFRFTHRFDARTAASEAG